MKLFLPNLFIMNTYVCFVYARSVRSTNEMLGADEIRQSCLSLDCERTSSRPVCGIKRVNDGFEYKVFENECLLLLNGCMLANYSNAYGRTKLSECQEKLTSQYIPDLPDDIIVNKSLELNFDDIYNTKSPKSIGENSRRSNRVQNETEIISSSIEIGLNESEKVTETSNNEKNRNIYVVDGFGSDIDPSNHEAYIMDYFNSNRYRNYTILSKEFPNSVTKKYEDINLEDYEDPYVNGYYVNDETPSRRNVIIKGMPRRPLFQWARDIPANRTGINEETKLSCFHTCPTVCPESYVPVCAHPGVGRKIRHPALAFKNHCYMDMAQCKAYHAEAKEHGRSVGYTESLFLYCTGDQMNNLVRFLPMLRTLQKMGRLRPKAVFKYRVRNFGRDNVKAPMISYNVMG